ncbi:very low-density lipoprotein receptor-like isoform X2 [Mercenaria mercenaria]|uniref:very low-density lipoprotein receptor-like isoform X2 n=1 Tax=Mercenaria mercenaria TaxID=6596 RepID=UPI00234F48A7|nr:very low-density lipoprotein receptor-like isoform X2 [Mercenaria mercenaria]
MKEFNKNYGLLILLLIFGCVRFLRADDVNEVTCESTHWQCLKSGKCIPLSWKCDSERSDCGPDDDSDEQNCPPKTCADEEFSCPSTGQCVPKRWVCDDDADCDNGEDEANCEDKEKGHCGVDEFSCDNGHCLSMQWRCDGVEDCDNGLDEMNCTATCDVGMFKCHDGNCISDSWLCDGDSDCLDGSDEIECGEKTCSDGEFKCDDKLRCIDIKWKCDGDFDCSDHSDETNNCTYTNHEEPEICSPSTEFKCVTSGECIHKSWQCDGDPDCTDSSDENNDCDYTCRVDQFMCENHVCISNTLKCDGNADCEDRSDEKNCVSNKTCDELGEFDCYGDSSFCIAIEKVCDGKNDCQRREDEDSALCKHRDPCLHHKCGNHSHCVNKAYSDSTLVAKCECNSGYRWVEEEKLCKDIDECEQPGLCSQICINTRGGYKCECYPGYTIEKHYFCRANGEKAWLYYTNRRDIRRLRTDSRYMEIIVEETTNSIALDIDYEDGLMFWTDGGTEKIMRAKVGGDAVLANDIQTLISNEKGDAFSPDGLAVDWLYKHFYWTDTGSDTIRVANYAGDKSKTLVSTGLDDPRAICVDPENGYMYWTDWGQNPKIERCGMNGENRETIVNGGDDLQWPNGLTIDYIGKRIYWIDSKLHKIGTANFDGSGKGHVLVDATEISRPFSISVFEDSLYWTDWHTNSIRSIHKITGRNAKTLSLGSYSVMDIKVYHELRQIRDFKEKAKDLCRNAQCEYMCLPAAKMSSNATVSCVCADNQQLKSDKRSCMAGPATPAHTPKPTTQAPITQKTGETTQKGSGTTPKPVQTTKGSGYTVVPEGTSTVGTPGKQEGNGVGGIAAITAAIVVVLLIVVFAVGCFNFRRYNSRNKKSMNFDNPVNGKLQQQTIIVRSEVMNHKWSR